MMPASADPVSQSDRKSCADSVYYVDKIFIPFDDTFSSHCIFSSVAIKNSQNFPNQICDNDGKYKSKTQFKILIKLLKHFPTFPEKNSNTNTLIFLFFLTLLYMLIYMKHVV